MAIPAFAQTLIPPEGTYNETLRDSAEISGAIIVGLQVRGKAIGSSGLDPKLSGLKEGDPVCVRIVSANGLYDSVNTYTYSSAANPLRPMIDLSVSKHDQFLRELKEDEIAASVALGSCSDPAKAYFPVSWGLADNQDVRLFVNSLRADTVVARIEETGAIERCEPVAVEVRSAYDTACDLNLDGLAGSVRVEIVRFVNRQPAPSDFVTLILPDA